MGIRPVFTHPWDLTPAEARALQQRLRSRVRVKPLPASIQVVGGVDVSIQKETVRAAVVLLSFPDLEPLEAATAELPVDFPYVPGLLAFREGPVVLDALERLRGRPDVLIFDAQGLAHPRRMGLATHIGVLLDWPAVGCAKSRLCGEHEEPPPEQGGWVPLMSGEEVIGAVVRTRTGVRPLFVSVGHRADLKTAVELVISCCSRYRLPEPTRWAHRVAGGEPLPVAQQLTLF
ncbi:MAG TPA: deoxyribonuclease V [Anaerolineales bacterium]|nr:deoxyribonuclease V [Anaerolineae bacterium]HIQ01075.1 deoxyribonuclease V [Anaerolineales bacterium]